MTNALAQSDYAAFLAGLKERILHARTSAARAVNHEMILLYWDIGRGIVEKQQSVGWGESVIDRLAADLRATFPNMTGFSARNLRDMKRMWQVYADPVFWRQPVANLIVGAKEETVWRQPVAKPAAGADQENAALRLITQIPWGHRSLH